jgi:hypothetical protein
MYSLPGGRTSENPEDLQDWRDLVAPLLAVTGWKVRSFSPGFALVDLHGEVIRLTEDQVNVLIRVIGGGS